MRIHDFIAATFVAVAPIAFAAAPAQAAEFVVKCHGTIHAVGKTPTAKNPNWAHHGVTRQRAIQKAVWRWQAKAAKKYGYSFRKWASACYRKVYCVKKYDYNPANKYKRPVNYGTISLTHDFIWQCSISGRPRNMS